MRDSAGSPIHAWRLFPPVAHLHGSLTSAPGVTTSRLVVMIRRNRPGAAEADFMIANQDAVRSGSCPARLDAAPTSSMNSTSASPLNCIADCPAR